MDYFAVYAPDLGPTEETEAEQVLFFHPENTSLDEKIKKIGLAQGLVNFTRCGSDSTKERRFSVPDIDMDGLPRQNVFSG